MLNLNINVVCHSEKVSTQSSIQGCIAMLWIILNPQGQVNPNNHPGVERFQ